jgi:hypothetical protein
MNWNEEGRSWLSLANFCSRSDCSKLRPHERPLKCQLRPRNLTKPMSTKPRSGPITGYRRVSVLGCMTGRFILWVKILVGSTVTDL